MHFSDLLSRSLSSKIAKYVFIYRPSHYAHPDVIYGTIEEDVLRCCRGVVYAGFDPKTHDDVELWHTKLYPAYRFALDDMRMEMNKAADRFEFQFEIIKSSEKFEFDREIIRDVS